MVSVQNVYTSRPEVIPADVLESLSPFHRVVLVFIARKYPHLVRIENLSGDLEAPAP